MQADHAAHVAGYASKHGSSSAKLSWPAVKLVMAMAMLFPDQKVVLCGVRRGGPLSLGWRHAASETLEVISC